MKSTASSLDKSQFYATPGYDAPELDRQILGEKDKYIFHQSDVYSIGMIVLRMCGIDYKSINSVTKAEFIRVMHDAALNLLFDSIKGFYSATLLDIVRRMTTYDREKRISVKEILAYIEGL